MITRCEYKLTSAPPSSPSSEEDVEDVENIADDDPNSSADNLSSPDIWNDNMDILETSHGHGLLSTSDIFEECDSITDDFAPNTSTPEATVSDDSEDDEYSRRPHSEPHKQDLNQLHKQLEERCLNFSPSELLKIESSSPEYLDLYSHKGQYHNYDLLETKWHAPKSSYGSENSYLRNLKKRPKTSYKIQDISVFNISNEVDNIMVSQPQNLLNNMNKIAKTSKNKISMIELPDQLEGTKEKVENVAPKHDPPDMIQKEEKHAATETSVIKNLESGQTIEGEGKVKFTILFT